MTTREKTNHPGIWKVTTSTGQVKYRLIVDLGEPGNRKQRCETFDRLGDAKRRQSEIRDSRGKGTLVKPSKTTVQQAIETWLAGRRNLRPTTVRNYAHTLRLVSSRLGHVQLQHLTKAHLDNLVTDLQKNGRRVGNVRSQSLGPRSINLMLTLLGSVLEDAVSRAPWPATSPGWWSGPGRSNTKWPPGPKTKRQPSWKRWLATG